MTRNTQEAIAMIKSVVDSIKTKEEAQAFLRKCGILGLDNQLVESLGGPTLQEKINKIHWTNIEDITDYGGLL